MGISSPLFSNASVNLGRIFFLIIFPNLRASLFLCSEGLIFAKLSGYHSLLYFSCTVHLCGDYSSLRDCSFLLTLPS